MTQPTHPAAQPLSVGRHADNCGQCGIEPSFEIGPQSSWIRISCDKCRLWLVYDSEQECVDQWNRIAAALHPSPVPSRQLKTEWLNENENPHEAANRVWNDTQYGKMPMQHDLNTLITHACTILHSPMPSADVAAVQASTILSADDDAKILQVIDERDAAEEALSQAYYLITGKSPEWSNLFGHKEALEEIDDAQRCFRSEASTAMAAENERLREALKYYAYPECTAMGVHPTAYFQVAREALAGKVGS